jgi:hypothetical protein
VDITISVHCRDLKNTVPRQNNEQQVHGPGILQYLNSNIYEDSDRNKEARTEEKLDWNSDDDNVLTGKHLQLGIFTHHDFTYSNLQLLASCV